MAELNQRWLILTTGVVVPSFGTVVFNVLGQLVKNGAKSDVPAGSFDFSLGCALAIVGVAVAQSELDRTRSLFVVFSLLMLILIGADIIARYRWPQWEIEMIVLSDSIAFLATAWAMWK